MYFVAFSDFMDLIKVTNKAQLKLHK